MIGGNGSNENRQGEIDKRRRARNSALFAVLMGIALLVYVVTIVRMGNP